MKFSLIVTIVHPNEPLILALMLWTKTKLVQRLLQNTWYVNHSTAVEREEVEYLQQLRLLCAKGTERPFFLRKDNFQVLPLSDLTDGENSIRRNKGKTNYWAHLVLQFIVPNKYRLHYVVNLTF